ncbi:Mup1p Ecym_2450 [Eremothecium cymbalariae DBVPG|uniref:Amino acid permease/ SLC12A domain-containing protein n=1 Tax=Eremothecium cymbalariae (strain CBS 270.75 / DBVPG 7215 / KCTC 17166 / NRRL Y-17582) TaxID=931890 RepID=G8JPC0_ERECY|nr:Hypothetical protein Ecym_2450 [Eremothecium cymbalariae DBVPG\
MPFLSQGKLFSRHSNVDEKDRFSTISDTEAAEHFITELDKGSKRLGLISCIGLICNRMLGTGIFVVTSKILELSGSVGLSLILWVIGSLIALAGLYVYMEFGTAIPRNGGEKNYLEFIFKKPKFFVTSMYAAYVFFLGWAAGNSVMAAQMFLTAGDVTVTKWNQRGLAVAVLTFCLLINSISVKAGLYFQNALGIFKIFIIVFISITGWVALAGGLNAPKTDNFHDAFSGTESATAYGVVNALYNVIWSFVGYSNVNYALGEVRNPVKTLKVAGPISLIVLAVLYMFVNIAYFAVVPRETIIGSELTLAAEFFRIAFGERAKKAAAIFIALSALGNVSSVIFSQGRIIQQLGREGVLPFSGFFATSKPLESPMVGLFQHFIVCTITILGPPPGDAYNFVMNLISYPMNIVNFTISSGLLWLYWQHRKGQVKWNPPIKAGVFAVTFFMLANLYLIVVPYIPPSGGKTVYKSLPYWIHCVVTWIVFGFGGLYWLVWAKLLPKWGNYKLVYSEVLGEDGFWRNNIVRRYNNEVEDNDNEVSNVSSFKVNDSNDIKVRTISSEGGS